MTNTINNTEPNEIVAGDYVQWTKQNGGYPASQGWTLSYVLLNSAAKITITTTASGDDFAINIPSATSAAYGAGSYQWQSYVTDGAGNRHTFGYGQMTINANFAANTTLDTRSSAKQTLDALDAEILSRATGGMTEEYTIGNRSLKKSSLPDLIVLRDKYNAIYVSEQNAERIKNGGVGKNRIFVRM